MTSSSRPIALADEALKLNRRLRDFGDRFKERGMGWLDRNRIINGGRAPATWRVTAYLVTGVVLLVVATALGAGGFTAGIAIAGAWLAVGASERFWSLRHGKAAADDGRSDRSDGQGPSER